MLTLIGSLIGFLGGVVPEFFKLFQDKRDKAHELKIMEMQMEQQKLGFRERLEMININADISESSSLYKTFYSGNKHADILNSIVRPVIALGFFLLYCLLKVIAYDSLPQIESASFAHIYNTLWTEEDAAIFAGIISFYFGNRAMNKLRNK